jgi:hypothetical protein
VTPVQLLEGGGVAGGRLLRQLQIRRPLFLDLDNAHVFVFLLPRDFLRIIH